MKRMFRFVKTMALVVAGAGLLASCQKDDVPNVNGEEDITLKKADIVGVDNDDIDVRNWGTKADWLSTTGSLSDLMRPNLPDRRPDLFVEVPTGIKVTGKSFVYLTFIGEIANFNNVLGYYTYKEDEVIGRTALELREIITEKIFTSDRKGVFMDQVVFSQTRDVEFGTTIELSDDGKEFEAGTVIGFYLLPNSSKGEGNSPYVRILDGKPNYIATDPELNVTVAEADGIISHIMGKSACNDLVIAFEDLNSLYSKTSDEDYNDLVFVVGDNLDRRFTENIEAYGGTPAEDLSYLGENCIVCQDAADELGCLVNYVKNKSTNPIYAPLFTDEYNSGLLPVDASTALYAKIAYANASWYNTIGWFEYEEGDDVESIKAKVTKEDGKTIDERYIIAQDVQVVPEGSSQSFIRLGGTGKGFSAGSKVAFFIVPRYITGSPVVLGASNTRDIRFTTMLSNDRQAQVVLAASCDNVMVSFEDNNGSAGDEDFNDIIFHISDNTASTSLSSFNIDNSGFFELSELNQRYKDAGSPKN